MMKYNEKLNTVAFIGNYVPRQCGIATFTRDLLSSISNESQNIQCSAIAMNNIDASYNYPDEVVFEINQNKISDYKSASSFLNINQIDLISLQHEFGIFGGSAGSNILHLIKNLRMPVVTTLHTVLEYPNREQKMVMENLIFSSDKLVVMCEKAREILIEIYKSDPEKVIVIPHGIPDIPFIDPNYYKDRFGVEGKKIIMTFGLLSPDKGIEYVLKSLPDIIRYHPDIVYIILGVTHPNVIKNSGEAYRLSLQKLVKDLSITDHVIFQNRYVNQKELYEFLGVADIYITPYLSEDQIVSGTLSYALGTGNAIISTPYLYAKEVLSEERGVIVPFRNSESISSAVISLLDNDIKRNSMRKKGYQYSRSSIWKEVARKYVKLFSDVQSERAIIPNRVFFLKKTDLKWQYTLPEIKWDHFISMTDDTGILQHATYTVPFREHGYCVDDNARAFLATIYAKPLLTSQKNLISNLSTKFLSFLQSAYNNDNNRFRNFMNYDRTWLEFEGSEDSHGRSIWVLGTAISNNGDEGVFRLSVRLFKKALIPLENFTSIRSIAFALIGINNYLKTFSGDSDVNRLRKLLADRLLAQYKRESTDDWPWFEETLTYCNSKIPHALLLSGSEMDQPEMVNIGIRSLKWLFDVQYIDDHFVPVGNSEWYRNGSPPSRFDQQPIDVQSMIEACIESFHISGDTDWIDRAIIAFNWFLGNNDCRESLYNPRSGGCRDGLTPDGLNENEGSESTIAWLLSLMAMTRLESENILNIKEKINNLKK